MRIRDKTRYLSTVQKTQTKCDIDFLFHFHEKGSRARLYYLLKKLEPHFSSLEDARREEYLHYSCGWLTQYSTRIWSAPLYLIFVNFGTPPHYLGL